VTTTYSDLRGYRGYSAIATHTRARAHAREIYGGLEITPHDPANPATKSRHVGAGSTISRRAEQGYGPPAARRGGAGHVKGGKVGKIA